MSDYWRRYPKKVDLHHRLRYVIDVPPWNVGVPMPNNDLLKSVENIVKLPTAARSAPLPTLQVKRPQGARPVFFESWVAVRDQAAASLLGGNRRLLLVGLAGTGKTVLIEHVARVLRSAGRTVIIQLADIDPAPPAPGETLFVDEADRLSAAKLRQLLGGAGTVVLAGLPPVVDRVAAGTAHLTLNPLGQAAARDYIAQWLSLNGRTPAELDGKAVRVLTDLSGGVPRLLSTLLSAGSWLASSSGARMIEAAHIQEAAELRSVLGAPSPPAYSTPARAPTPRSRVLWSALLAAVALAGAGAAIAPRLFPAETEQAIARVTAEIDRVRRWRRAEPTTAPPRQAMVAAPIRSPLPALATAEPAAIQPAQIAPPAAVAEVPRPTAELPLPQPAPALVHAAAPVLATPVGPAVVASSANLPPEMIEFLLHRGREMLALNDLSAARLLFQRAAEDGSAEAMIALGQTYDPAFRPGLNARQSDREEALRWYRRAAASGDGTAERLLLKP